MKILFVAGLDPLLAQGHASHVRHLVDELAGRGHRIDVIARDESGTLSWDPPGRLFRLSREPIPILGQLSLELRTRALLRRRIAETQPDVVLARSETLAFAPLVTPQHVPLAIESNASLVRHQLGSRSPRARLIAKIEGDLLRRAECIGVVAPSLLEAHRQIHAIDPARCFVVRNGAPVPPPLDPESIVAKRAAVGAADSDFVVALSGSASERIEFAWIVRAIEQTERAQLWVMGQGELWETWKRRAAESSARERIRFLGALPEEEATRYAQAAQVIVAPYAEGEIERLGGDPLKVLHAMASGRPLLASGIPGDPPFDGLGAGWRIHAGPEAWTTSICELRSKWQGEGKPLGSWPWEGDGPGRAWILEHRTWAHAAEIWERQLVQICSGSR